MVRDVKCKTSPPTNETRNVDIHRNAQNLPNLKNLGMDLGSPSRFPPLPTLEGVLMRETSGDDDRFYTTAQASSSSTPSM